MVMKAWVYLAFLLIGNTLVLREIPFFSFLFSYLNLFFSYMSLPLIQQGI